jgi:hypothetical protein
MSFPPLHVIPVKTGIHLLLVVEQNPHPTSHLLQRTGMAADNRGSITTTKILEDYAMFKKITSLILILVAVLSPYFMGCSEENVTNPTTYVHDTTLVTTHDTTVVYDTTIVTAYDTLHFVDTVVIVDTVEVAPALEGEWLKFSAYEATKAFVKEAYPARATDRFSRMGTYCDYGGNPAGRAGFKFVDNGDSTYTAGGYTFEYVFGAAGWVWGAAQSQPTENTYSYGCTMRLNSDGDWTLLNVSLGPCGAYIRDTRHD